MRRAGGSGVLARPGRRRLRARARPSRAPHHRRRRRRRGAGRAARRPRGGVDGSGLMCGVFGVFSRRRDVARLAYFGLFALQHRGQESAGIAVADGGHITVLREMGLVAQVFSEEKLRGLAGHAAIGQTRYSTTGSSKWANAQPLVHHGPARTVAVAHNGNLTNAGRLRGELRSGGTSLGATSDTEVIAALLAQSPGDVPDAAAA